MCIEKSGKYDELTSFNIREYGLGDLIAYVQQIHGVKAEVLHNTVFEELDRAQNDVLRDIQRKDAVSFEAAAHELRQLLVRMSDTHKFELSLVKAKQIVQKGGSVEEASLQIYYPDSGLQHAATFLDQAKNIMSSHNPNPLITGIPIIDDHGGLEKGNIMALGGDTGAMKTRTAIWLCIQMLRQNTTDKCCFFEKEMTKRDVLYILCSYLFDKPYIVVRNWTSEFLLAKLEELSDEERSIFDRLIIFDSEEIKSAEDVYYQVNRHRPGFWVVDFLTMMVSGESKTDGINLAVYNIVDKFKTIAQRTDSLGILVSQLKKGTVESRANKIPTMDDFEWSGRLKQLCAYAFSVFLPSYYDADVPRRYYYIKDAKHRYGERFWIYLQAYPESGTFHIPVDAMYWEMDSWIKNYVRGGTGR